MLTVARGVRGVFHGVIDAVAQAGKIMLQEDDMRTYLWTPSGERAFTTEADTLNALRRNMGNVMAHNNGTWWMDLTGNGNFNGQSMWDTISSCVATYNASIATSEALKAQVALIYDEETNEYMRADSYNVNAPSCIDQRIVFQTLGAQVGYYHVEDMPNLPSTVKLIVFVNPWRLTDAERTLINNAKSGNRTFLWMYAPGYVTSNSLDTAAVSSLTGFTLAKYSTGIDSRITVSNSGYPITNGISGTTFGNSSLTSPTFYVNGGTYTSLGVYTGTARVGFAEQFNSGWKSIFCGTPELSVSVARAIARDSGVNLLNNADVLSQNDSISYNGSYLYLYGIAAAGNRWLQLPNEEVANGGFERFTTAFPTTGENCWVSPYSGTITCTIAATGAHTGTNCAKTPSFSTAAGSTNIPIAQLVQLDDATTYTISGWVYVDTLTVTNAATGSYIRLMFGPQTWTAAGKYLSIAEYRTKYQTNRTWTQFTTTYYHSKTSNQYPELYIQLKIYGRYSATSIKLDDISVRPLGSRTVTVTDYLTGSAVTTSSGTGWPVNLTANGAKIYKLQ